MPNEYPALLVNLQCCHSVLSTPWPRPGFPQLAGAHHFIGTNVFKALEGAVDRIGQQVAGLVNSQLKAELLQVWGSVARVVSYLRDFGKETDATSVDRAFNLLYLVTGIAYHRVAAELSEKPQQDERYSTVEDVADLLRLCAWRPTQPTAQLPQLLRELVAQLDAVPKET